ERGMHTGLETSKALSASLVLLKDPYTRDRVAAFGFDPASGTNLFVFSVAPADVESVQDAFVADASQWKAGGSSEPRLDGITDGIGGVPVPPRPGLLVATAWKHAFYAWSVQEQIAQEAQATTR